MRALEARIRSEFGACVSQAPPSGQKPIASRRRPTGAPLASGCSMLKRCLRDGYVLAVVGWLASSTGASGCADVIPRAPHDYSNRLENDLCIEDVILLSSILQESGVLSSCISESDCDRAIDPEEGHFQTWHVYADQTSKLVLEAESEFDNLMELVLVTDHSDDQIDEELVAKNDDRSAVDLRARLSGILQADQNYLIRLSSFGDKETGCYTIDATAVDMLPPSPSTGSIEVMVSSTGGAPADYTVTLNGAKEKSVAANGTATYGDIVTGDYVLGLSGLGDCTVSEENPQSVTVNASQTTTASFDIQCPCKPDTPDGTSCDGGAGRCQSGVCVQSPPALSNPVLNNLDVNNCADPRYPSHTTHSYSVSYSDPDGDVTSSGTRVFLSSRDEFGITSGPFEIQHDKVVVSGDGSAGAIVAKFCILFRAASWIVVSMEVSDAAGNVSDPVEKMTARPPGAD